MSYDFDPQCELLSVLLNHNEAYWKVCGIVCPEDFSPLRRRIYVAIAEAVKAGETADFITLGNTLGDEVGAEARQIQCNVAVSYKAVESYARFVAEAGEKKRVREAGGRIMATASTYTEAQSILAQDRPQQMAGVKSVKDGLSEMVETLQRRYEADGSVTGIPTGVESLDAMTSGWQAGNLVVVAARPGMGKTAYALQCAIGAGRTLFVSLEMTAGELMERAVANVGQLPQRWMRFPKEAPDHALTLITEASRKASVLPLQIDDTAARSVDAISSIARQAHEVEPLRLIVVDHLGLVGREGRHDASELGAITAQLKRLAKELKVTVMLLCQLNRGLEARTDRRPLLSDLRDSGRIEEDADVVLALYRDEYYSPDGPLAGYLELILRKNRSGELGTAWAHARLSQMRLETCDEPERSAGAPASNNGSGGFAARFAKGGQSRPMAMVGRDD
jgi:replicative DNA helicase